MTQYAIIDAGSQGEDLYGLIEAESEMSALANISPDHLFWADRAGFPKNWRLVAADELADGKWREVAPCEPTEVGDIGGDVQMSEAWSRRFTLRRPDGEWALVTDAYYVACDDAIKGEVTAESVRHVQNQIEFLTCTDLRDPGGTETWAEYEYDVMVDMDAIEENAKRYAERSSAGYFETWDGMP